MKKDEKRYRTVNNVVSKNFTLEKGMFLASSVNRFLEDILSSSNQNHDNLKVYNISGCPTLLLWRSLKQPQGKAARINTQILVKNVFGWIWWTWKPICSSMNLPCILSLKCAAAYPDRATTSIHPTRCAHARMVVHGFLGPWCQLTSVSATIKIHFSYQWTWEISRACWTSGLS